MTATAIRRVAVVAHRWTGLLLAANILVVAATGALLPFQDDLERFMAPERFVAQPLHPIDWIGLRDLAEWRSGGVVDLMPLGMTGGAAQIFHPSAKRGQPPLGFDEILLDPSTGREISRARSGDPRDGTAQVIPFLYRVHEDLAAGDLGTLLVGVVALAWTVDCFVGFYLTLPVGAVHWWRKWRLGWSIRWPTTSAFRLHFDLHRAGGLWLWAMLFIFAWSGVSFNLPTVYGPVMHALTGYEIPEDRPMIAQPRAPRLGWAEGLAAARQRAADAARAKGFHIVKERELRYQRASNRYALALRTDRDRSDKGENSWVNIDADSGALISVELPTGENAGNTIDYWLGMIHEASVGGFVDRLAVCLSGIAIVVITCTGILIWRRKRVGAVRRARRAGKLSAAMRGSTAR